MLCLGTRDSSSMEAKSARWVSSETRLLKASWSSCEAGRPLATRREMWSGDAYLIFRIASFRGYKVALEMISRR